MGFNGYSQNIMAHLEQVNIAKLQNENHKLDKKWISGSGEMLWDDYIQPMPYCCCLSPNRNPNMWPWNPKTMSFLGFPKVIPYNKFDQFGIIHLWIML